MRFEKENKIAMHLKYIMLNRMAFQDIRSSVKGKMENAEIAGNPDGIHGRWDRVPNAGLVTGLTEFLSFLLN